MTLQVETEELHRVAYNMAFEEFGLEVGGSPVVWSVDYYGHLANTVGGGKPKMRYHFTGLGAPEGAKTHPDVARQWPAVTKRDGSVPTDETAGMALVDELQDFKTECYKKLVTTAPPRPGVLELMDSAIATPGVAVGICSASTRAGFEKVAVPASSDPARSHPRGSGPHRPRAQWPSPWSLTVASPFPLELGGRLRCRPRTSEQTRHHHRRR